MKNSIVILLLSFVGIFLTGTVSAQTQVSNNIQVNAPKPLDSRFLKGINLPWADKADVQATITTSKRYPGLMLCIGQPTDFKLYWFFNGTDTANLVPMPLVYSLTATGTGMATFINGVLNIPPPVAQVQSDWNASSGLGVILNKPTIPAAQVNSDWTAVTGLAQILNKPSLSAVATSGSYADLTNKPTIPSAQVNSDWTAVSGLSQILNKPSLSTVAISGSYTDLANKPTIPSAQVQSDWNAVSGLGVILNKPSIPSAPVNPDWNAVSGLAQILNKPSIPASQVQTDWNASSGIGVLLNKPTIDGTPTNGSSNLVSSNAVYQALLGKQVNLVSGSTIATVNGVNLLQGGNLTITGSGTVVDSPSRYVEQTATANQTVFTPGFIISTNPSKVSVFVNGVLISKALYNVTTTTVTFNTGLDLNDKFAIKVDGNGYGSGSGLTTANFYQTVESNLTPLTQRNKLNFGTEFTVTDNSSDTSTGITVNAIAESKVTNLVTDLSNKQATLVSGTNIKTWNGISLMGSGNIIPDTGRGITQFVTGYSLNKVRDSLQALISAGGGNSIDSPGHIAYMTATNGQTVFTPGFFIPTDVSKTIVSKNGLLVGSNNFTLSNSSVTFGTGLNVNDTVRIQVYGTTFGLVSSGGSGSGTGATIYNTGDTIKSCTGDAIINGDAYLKGSIKGNVLLNANLTILPNTVVNNIVGDITGAGFLFSFGQLNVRGNITLANSNAEIDSNFTVTGNFLLNNTATILQISGTLSVGGNVNCYSLDLRPGSTTDPTHVVNGNALNNVIIGGNLTTNGNGVSYGNTTGYVLSAANLTVIGNFALIWPGGGSSTISLNTSGGQNGGNLTVYGNLIQQQTTNPITFINTGSFSSSTGNGGNGGNIYIGGDLDMYGFGAVSTAGGGSSFSTGNGGNGGTIKIVGSINKFTTGTVSLSTTGGAGGASGARGNGGLINIGGAVSNGVTMTTTGAIGGAVVVGQSCEASTITTSGLVTNGGNITINGDCLSTITATGLVNGGVVIINGTAFGTTINTSTTSLGAAGNITIKGDCLSNITANSSGVFSGPNVNINGNLGSYQTAPTISLNAGTASTQAGSGGSLICNNINGLSSFTADGGISGAGIGGNGGSITCNMVYAAGSTFELNGGSGTTTTPAGPLNQSSGSINCYGYFSAYSVTMQGLRGNSFTAEKADISVFDCTVSSLTSNNINLQRGTIGTFTGNFGRLSIGDCTIGSLSISNMTLNMDKGTYIKAFGTVSTNTYKLLSGGTVRCDNWNGITTLTDAASGTHTLPASPELYLYKSVGNSFYYSSVGTSF